VGAPEDDVWHFDLAAVLATDSNLSSFDMLLPILQRGGFRRMEVLCDHLPRWVAPMLRGLGLRVQVDEIEPVSPGDTGRLRAVVEPVAGPSAAAPHHTARPSGACRGSC